MMWSSIYYFEVTVHQIFADLCPFESFCKLLAAYFFFFFWLFIFVLLLFGQILMYREKQISQRLIWCVLLRKHFSLEAANFSLFSQEEEVTSPLISGPAWTLRLQFTKYQQRYATMNFFNFFFCNSTYSLYLEH